MRVLVFFFFKQKTAYEMRISDWSQTCALPISLGREATAHDLRDVLDVGAGGQDRGAATGEHPDEGVDVHLAEACRRAGELEAALAVCDRGRVAVQVDRKSVG